MEIMLELIIVLVILIIVIIFLSYKITNNKFNIYDIKFDKSETKLKKCLDEKFEVTLKIIDFLNKNISIDEDELHEFLNTNLKKISLEELNNVIIDADKHIEKCLSRNEKIINNEEFVCFNKKLIELNITINAIKKYYNTNVKEYNLLIKKFPTNIIAKIKKYQEKNKLKESPNEKLKILNK